MTEGTLYLPDTRILAYSVFGLAGGESLKKTPKKGIPQIISRLADVEQNLLSDVNKLKHVAATTAMEAVKNGSKGAVYEAGLYFNKPGYNLRELKQPIHYWWGSDDKAVIPLHAEALEQQAPGSVLHYKHNEGLYLFT